MQAKQTRKPFKHVLRNTLILELIHNDICDMNNILTKGENRYFITFIHDFSKYCHAYLIKTKDEALDKFKLHKSEVENQKKKEN